MMKSLICMSFLFFASQSWAAPQPDEDLNAEVQRELDSVDEETIVFDAADEEFLNKSNTAEVQVKKQNGVVWGKVIEPGKKAELSKEKPVIKK